jgi:Ala-tRNA(Pro) deacylase
MLNQRTRHLLEEKNVPFEVFAHRVTFTAPDTAAAAHVPGRQFAKVVVVQARAGHPLMVVLPANCHLDLEKLADVTGHGPLALVHEDELNRLFPECEVGAMPPFGNLYGMPVVVASCLSRCDEVFFNAESHRETIRMRYADLETLVHPIVGDVCKHH